MNKDVFEMPARWRHAPHTGRVSLSLMHNARAPGHGQRRDACPSEPHSPVVSVLFLPLVPGAVSLP